MSKTVRAIVITGNGVNCEKEMALACRLGGAECVDIVHIAELLAGRVTLGDYHFINFPGGFLDGDDLGSAKAGVNRLQYAPVAGRMDHLIDQLRAAVAGGKLVIGVCNGFQLLVKAGLLPAIDPNNERQTVTLTCNERGRFEDRWCWLQVDQESPCVFTRGLERLYLPIRHGEGKFVAESAAELARIEEKRLGVLKYCHPETGSATLDYPWNPNGSQAAIAGICDPSGLVFGLMPHPEAYLFRTHHPRWTREPGLPEEGMGLWLFRNAIEYIRQQLL
ncbi:MAG: phosphoribosylformylglycinamidine synthase subunit PurQ [Desulfuromonadaceae bacterium]|nr:phosphoribosylformylglycinamidine synthase subunit PurQ [Desulfuromonadaceae bacterium]